MLTKKLVIAAVFLCCSNLAWADGSATIMSGGATSKVEFAEGKYLRMEAPESGGYMLMRDDKLYSVVSEGGAVMVVDIAAAMRAMGNSGQQDSFWDDDIAEVKSFQATGASETVAGITGEVYQLEALDKNGNAQTSTLVLTDHDTVVELSEAMYQMSHTLVSAAGDETPKSLAAMYNNVIAHGRGILRQGDEFELVSISATAPEADRFRLPAEPMQLPVNR